jgi:hypothetical protein
MQAAILCLSIFDYNQAALDTATARLREQGHRIHPFLVHVSVQDQGIKAVDEAEAMAPILPAPGRRRGILEYGTNLRSGRRSTDRPEALARAPQGDTTWTILAEVERVG